MGRMAAGPPLASCYSPLVGSQWSVLPVAEPAVSASDVNTAFTMAAVTAVECSTPIDWLAKPTG